MKKGGRKTTFLLRRPIFRGELLDNFQHRSLEVGEMIQDFAHVIFLWMVTFVSGVYIFHAISEDFSIAIYRHLYFIVQESRIFFPFCKLDISAVLHTHTYILINKNNVDYILYTHVLHFCFILFLPISYGFVVIPQCKSGISGSSAMAVVAKPLEGK